MVGVHVPPSSNHPSVQEGCFCILAVVSPGMQASLWKWSCWVIGSLVFSILRTVRANFSAAAPFCILIGSVPASRYCGGLSVFQPYFTAELVLPHGGRAVGGRARDFPPPCHTGTSLPTSSSSWGAGAHQSGCRERSAYLQTYSRHFLSLSD